MVEAEQVKTPAARQAWLRDESKDEVISGE
jgi:hypothetical protein